LTSFLRKERKEKEDNGTGYEFDPCAVTEKEMGKEKKKEKKKRTTLYLVKCAGNKRKRGRMRWYWDLIRTGGGGDKKERRETTYYIQSKEEKKRSIALVYPQPGKRGRTQRIRRPTLLVYLADEKTKKKKKKDSP